MEQYRALGAARLEDLAAVDALHLIGVPDGIGGDVYLLPDGIVAEQDDQPSVDQPAIHGERRDSQDVRDLWKSFSVTA